MRCATVSCAGTARAASARDEQEHGHFELSDMKDTEKLELFDFECEVEVVYVSVVHQ